MWTTIDPGGGASFTTIDPGGGQIIQMPNTLLDLILLKKRIILPNPPLAILTNSTDSEQVMDLLKSKLVFERFFYSCLSLLRTLM